MPRPSSRPPERCGGRAERARCGKKTVEDTKADIEKAKDELAKDQALKDDLDHVDEDASLAAGTTVFQAGWTAKNEFATLNVA